MGTKFRLKILYFLQFFVWGSWLISLGSYAGSKLGFTGLEIGSFYASMGIASLFMPALVGIIADKYWSAQKVFGVCHLAGTVLLILAAYQHSYASLYPIMLLYVICYMPTIALSNTVGYSVLSRGGYDVVKDFPPIRVWGTIGFIIAMWTVDLTGFKSGNTQFLLAAAASAILGLYSFSLPDCPPMARNQKKNLVDALGLNAFALFKEWKMFIFFFFAMLLGAALQITNAFGDAFLNSFASVKLYADSFGVRHSVVLLSLSQISETLFILTIPFFLKRFGIKVVMTLSMLAWFFRFALFGIGNPGPGIGYLVLSMVVYGMAFDFFNISGSLFVEQSTDSKMRGSAQGLFMLMTNGFGAVFGSLAAGKIVDLNTSIKPVERLINGQWQIVQGTVTDWRMTWFTFAAYALIVAVLFIILFRYKKPGALRNA